MSTIWNGVFERDVAGVPGVSDCAWTAKAAGFNNGLIDGVSLHEKRTYVALVGCTWVLTISCDGAGGAPIIIWQGTKPWVTDSTPDGTYTRVDGCDLTATLRIKPCVPPPSESSLPSEPSEFPSLPSLPSEVPPSEEPPLPPSLSSLIGDPPWPPLPPVDLTSECCPVGSSESYALPFELRGRLVHQLSFGCQPEFSLVDISEEYSQWYPANPRQIFYGEAYACDCGAQFKFLMTCDNNPSNLGVDFQYRIYYTDACKPVTNTIDDVHSVPATWIRCEPCFQALFRLPMGNQWGQTPGHECEICRNRSVVKLYITDPNCETSSSSLMSSSLSLPSLSSSSLPSLPSEPPGSSLPSLPSEPPGSSLPSLPSDSSLPSEPSGPSLSLSSESLSAGPSSSLVPFPYATSSSSYSFPSELPGSLYPPSECCEGAGEFGIVDALPTTLFFTSPVTPDLCVNAWLSRTTIYDIQGTVYEGEFFPPAKAAPPNPPKWFCNKRFVVRLFCGNLGNGPAWIVQLLVDGVIEVREVLNPTCICPPLSVPFNNLEVPDYCGPNCEAFCHPFSVTVVVQGNCCELSSSCYGETHGNHPHNGDLEIDGIPLPNRCEQIYGGPAPT